MSVYYLHGDHLGSTSLTTNQSGAVVAETRYLPYGQERWTSGATPTDFGFTSQRKDGFGLMDYNARYYSPILGRFISPDGIVPEPGNPQSVNRYSYVLNRPLQGGDPTGHDGPVPDFDVTPNWLDWVSGLATSVNDSTKEALAVTLEVAYKEVSYLAGEVSRQLPPDPYGLVEGTTWPFDESSFNEGFNAWDKVVAEGNLTGIVLETGIRTTGTYKGSIYKGVEIDSRFYPDDVSLSKQRIPASSSRYSYAGMFDSYQNAMAAAVGEAGPVVQIADGKWRSIDGHYQVRAIEGIDIGVSDPHIHLEALDPKTGKVTSNIHYYFTP